MSSISQVGSNFKSVADTNNTAAGVVGGVATVTKIVDEATKPLFRDSEPTIKNGAKYGTLAGAATGAAVAGPVGAVIGGLIGLGTGTAAGGLKSDYDDRQSRKGICNCGNCQINRARNGK